LGEDGTETEMEINKPAVSYAGEQMIYNDLTQMKLKSVRVIMGPSYASRRQEAVSQLTQLIQAMPQLGQIAFDPILDFRDGKSLINIIFLIYQIASVSLIFQ
jgi:hypothetical protein